MHKHPVINAAVMLAGDLTVVTGSGTMMRFRGGDAIVEVVDQWHYGYNDGPDVAELVVFYAGAQGQPITSHR
jgi:quercetin dioxygenase-like cupin family protein